MSEQDDDNTLPESGARNIHVAPSMGQNTIVQEVVAVGVVNDGFNLTVNRQGDDERLRDDLRKLRSNLTVREREKCDKQAVVQDLKSKTNNLEKEVQHLKQQACARAGDIQNMEKKIGKLMEDVKTHTDIENLEKNIIPDLKEQIQTVEIRLVQLIETVEDTTNAIPDLEKRMEGLKKDLEKYCGEIKSQKEYVVELCILIEQLKKDILDQKKEQKTMAARIQKIETDEQQINAEMAKQKKQLEDERREKEELQRKTQKQHEEMTEMQAKQVKMEQQLNDEREAAERKIQEQAKLIQDLMEQTQQASSDPRVSPIQLSQQETDLHATPSPADCGDLRDASWAGNLEEVKRLLSLGDDVNCRGLFSRTPVMWAAVGGHRDVLELLVSEGADVSLVDENGDNTLHFACIEGDLETVKFVLSLNVVDINSRGGESQTPVMRAAVGGHRDVVEHLVSEGADVSLVDKVGNNILHLACWGGHLETVEFVLSLHVVDINSRGERSWTPVMKAALRGHRDVVELLVSEGADVSLVGVDGDNILHLASWGGDLETVEFVLSLNVVDIGARNNSGQTAVSLARSRGHPRVLDLLVSRGAQ